MKVVRWTWHAKKNCSRELIEAIKSYPEYGLPSPPHGGRFYSNTTLGPWDVVIQEADIESLAEYDAWMKESFAAPRLQEWIDLRSDLLDRGGGGEIWNVEKFE